MTVPQNGLEVYNAALLKPACLRHNSARDQILINVAQTKTPKSFILLKTMLSDILIEYISISKCMETKSATKQEVALFLD